MALEIKKTSRETSQSLVRRFSRRIKQSGILVQTRKGRFYQRKKSKQIEKRAALRRKQLKENRKKLERMGKI